MDTLRLATAVASCVLAAVACRADEAVPTSFTKALTEILNELKAHRAALAAIRQGIETGYPTT